MRLIVETCGRLVAGQVLVRCAAPFDHVFLDLFHVLRIDAIRLLHDGINQIRELLGQELFLQFLGRHLPLDGETCWQLLY